LRIGRGHRVGISGTVVESLPLAVRLTTTPSSGILLRRGAARSSTWTIDLGDANMAMLEPLYRAMSQARAK
jgi:hypothetical protein